MTDATYPWQGGTIQMLDDAALRALGLQQIQIVDTIEHALHAQADGQIWTSPKATLTPGDQRYMMTTLSASDTPAVSVVKVVSVGGEGLCGGSKSIHHAVRSWRGCLIYVTKSSPKLKMNTCIFLLVRLTVHTDGIGFHTKQIRKALPNWHSCNLRLFFGQSHR